MSRNLKRTFLIVALSVCAIAGVLIATVDERTGEALLDVRPVYLALFGALWIMALTFDALSIMLYTRGTVEKLGYFAAIKTATLRIFFNIVTPFGFGGQPFSILSLKREGVPPGKGTSIVVMKLVTLSAFIQVGALVSFLFYYRQIETMRLLSTVFTVAGFVGVAFIVLLISGFIYPRILVRTATAVGKLLHSVRIVKNIENLKRGVIREAVTARKSFRHYFSKHLGYFISATICNGLNYFTQLVLLWVILQALGIDITLADSLVLSAILFFLIMFMPTPGALGFGEAFFFLLYANLIPTYLLGIALVLWRFFYHYMSAFVGAISSSKYVSDMIVGRAES